MITLPLALVFRNSRMKKLFFIALMSCFTTAFAQTTTDSTDHKLKRQDMFFITLNYEGLLNTPAGVTQKFWNRGVDVGFMLEQPMSKSGISVAAGVMYGNQNYYTNSTISEDTTGFNGILTSAFNVNSDALDVKSNKLALSYVDFPLELRYRFNQNKPGMGWRVAVGFKFGYLFDAHSKQINNQGKFKEFNYNNFRNWRNGVTLRAGYGRANLYMYYGLTPLFESSTSPNVHPFSIGLTLCPF